MTIKLHDEAFEVKILKFQNTKLRQQTRRVNQTFILPVSTLTCRRSPEGARIIQELRRKTADEETNKANQPDCC